MDFIQPHFGQALNSDLALFSDAQNIIEATLFLHAFGDLDAKDFPAFGAQSFIDGVARVNEFFHERSHAFNRYIPAQGEICW